MMDEPKKPPSLRDFDYFADNAEAPTEAPGTASSEFDDPNDDRAERRQLRTRAFMTAAVTMVFLLVTGWFLWGYWDAAVYAFMPPQAPLQLGDVTDLTPEQIPHNTYVTVHGITEHRGLRQVVMRGLNWSRGEYWYFRLLGSRGVFIEVEPNSEKFGFTTEVTVSGRAVDPERASMYADLLRSYEDTFASENRATTRVIQVNVRPGENRLIYGGAVGVLGGLALANVFALLRLLGRLRR